MAQMIVAAEVDGDKRLDYDSDFDSPDLGTETSHSDSGDDSLLPAVKVSQSQKSTQVGAFSTVPPPQAAPNGSFLTSSSDSNGSTTNPAGSNGAPHSSGMLSLKTVDGKQPSTGAPQLGFQSRSQPLLATTSQPLLGTTSQPLLGTTTQRPPGTTTQPALGTATLRTTTRPPLCTTSRPALATTSQPSLHPPSHSSYASSPTKKSIHPGFPEIGFSPNRSQSDPLVSNVSPLRLSMGHHQRSVDETERNFSKIRKLSEINKKKSERRHKIEKLERGGGIRGRIKKWEKKKERESDTHVDIPLPDTVMGASTPSGASFSLPTKPPGKSVFTNPPNLISELYPPGIELEEDSPFVKVERNLTQNNPEVLREMICGGLLKLCYEYKPCPQSVWQWLFQIVCRSDDPSLSSGAFRSLLALLQSTERRRDLKSIHLPSVSDVVDVLVCLGANLNQPLPSGEAMEVDGNDDVFVTPKPPLRNISGLLNYLCVYIRILPGCYTVEELESLVLLLMKLSLDPVLCGQILECDLSLCIGSLLAALPEESWAKSANLLSGQALNISHHHHNRLYLATVISGVSQRQKFLQRIFCKECITQELKLHRATNKMEKSTNEMKMVTKESDLVPFKVKVEKVASKDILPLEAKVENEANKGDLLPPEVKTAEESMRSKEGVTNTTDTQNPNYGSLNENCLFAREVVLHYHYKRTLDYDYYSMYSVLTMLTFFMHPTEMEWPSIEERKKFEHLLSAVSDKIRNDDPKKGHVKDLIIRMKLEVNTQRSAGTKQTQLLF